MSLVIGLVLPWLSKPCVTWKMYRLYHGFDNQYVKTGSPKQKLVSNNI